MTSTSSLMAAAPLFCSPSAKPRRDSAARPGVLLARPLRNARRSRPLGQRWMHGGARVKPQANTRLFYSWKQHNHRIDRKDALGFPTEQPGSLACFRSCQCCRGHMRRQATGMFQNKSTFSIHRHPFWSSTAKRTLMMKHEAESKTNAYWLGLLAHLQSSSTPRKLKVDENSLFSCIGVAGAQSSEDAPGAVDEATDIGKQGFSPSGRGLSTMTRLTT